LNELNIEYSEKCNLPKLYSDLKKNLNLNPSNIEDGLIRKALGSCTTLVQFLCEVRNDLGDAHGNACKNTLYPSQEITRLVISLSGHLSVWLISAYPEIGLIVECRSVAFSSIAA